MRDRKSSIPLLQDYDGIVDYLESEVRLITDDTTTQDSYGQKYVGLWDTGSSRSCIRTDIIEKLGLSFTGRSLISTANGRLRVKTYTISIQLPNDEIIPNLIVSAANLESNVDVLIGMDVIRKGDFHIDNSSGRTNFSFVI